MAETFRQKLERFAIKRALNMLNASPLTKDLVADYNAYAGPEGKQTVLDTLVALSGLTEIEECYLCLFHVDHNCVNNLSPD